MRVKEKVGVFDYQSGNSQGILIHVLGMNPVVVYKGFVNVKRVCQW